MLTCDDNGITHIFEPRYDETSEINVRAHEQANKFEVGTPINDCREFRKIYVCDICTRCGTKIKRTERT